MKGKKADPAFVSQFIQESVREGAETPKQIVARAKAMIETIDEQIKAIEAKKVVRSKLLDVIASFDKPMIDKSDDADLLPFFSLDNPDACKAICDVIKIRSLNYSEIHSNIKWGTDTIFTIKQLISCGVLERDQWLHIVRGERFNDYMKYVLHEDD